MVRNEFRNHPQSGGVHAGSPSKPKEGSNQNTDSPIGNPTFWFYFGFPQYHHLPRPLMDLFSTFADYTPFGGSTAGKKGSDSVFRLSLSRRFRGAKDTQKNRPRALHSAGAVQGAGGWPPAQQEARAEAFLRGAQPMASIYPSSPRRGPPARCPFFSPTMKLQKKVGTLIFSLSTGRPSRGVVLNGSGGKTNKLSARGGFSATIHYLGRFPMDRFLVPALPQFFMAQRQPQRDKCRG